MNEQNTAKPLHPALRAYLCEVRALAANYKPNPFWEQQLSALQIMPEYERLEEADTVDLEKIIQKDKFAFQDLPPAVERLRARTVPFYKLRNSCTSLSSGRA